MADTETARRPVDDETKTLARKMGRMMWRLDNPDKVKAKDSSTFKDEAKVYSKKALRLVQAMRAKGFEIKQPETAETGES